MPRLLAVLLLLGTPALAGRTDRRAERDFLAASCEGGRTPVDQRFLRGTLPVSGPDARALPASAILVSMERGELFLNGIPTRPAALPSLLAGLRRARPADPFALALPAELPEPSWGTVLAALPADAEVLVVVEQGATSRPPSPDPQVRDRIVDGRAAVRRSVEDPFARLAALEAIPVQIGLPRADCRVLEAVLRTPLGPDATCADRVDDAWTALSACDLGRKARTRATAALGEAWHPTDRAELRAIRLVRSTPSVASGGRTWAEWVSRPLEGQKTTSKD